MRFPTKKTANEWEDTEGESDIISEIEDDVNFVGDVNYVGDVDYVGSFLKNNDDNELPTQEWNDPWSSDAWNELPWGDGAAPVASNLPSVQNQKHVDTSFDSLQFRPLLKTTGEENDILDLNIVDAFGAPFGAAAFPVIAAASNDSSKLTLKGSSQGTNPQNLVKETKINVNMSVVLKERLSIVFDDITKDPLCRVVGSIYVKPTKRKISSFCLTVRDKRALVEHWDEQNSRCRNITAGVPHLALDPGDQVYLISLNREHQQDPGLDAPIVSYTCIPRLRPMPMLLKTKIHQKSDRCRLGTRIRANPQNSYVLKDIVILIIVPVELDGENVTMSRKGGVWDEMKRTLIWNIPKLDPGEIVDIQAQFKNNTEWGVSKSKSHDHANSATAGGGGYDGSEFLKFPVLARCNGDTNFSKIDMNTNYNEDGSNPVGLELERLATVLYRKV